MMRRPRVLYLVSKPDASAWWRVVRPVTRLAEAGYSCAWADIKDVTLLTLGQSYDAVVLTRLYWPDHSHGEQIVHGLKRQGITVLYEVDDDWYSPGVSERLVRALPGHPEIGTVEDQERARADRIFALRLADGVIASSDGLAEVCRDLTTAPVTVVPNAIDAAWWAEQLEHHERLLPGLTVGWLGGPRLEDDLAPVAEAWGRIAEKYPEVQFIMTGTQPGGVAAAVPPERVWPIPWQPIDALPRAMAQIDIACCAVADNRWNRCKTPIKAWEATLSGAAVVASPTLYEPCVTERTFVARTADDWTAHLSLLIDVAGMREQVIGNMRQHVLTDHSLATQMHCWSQAWAALVDQARAVAV